ncbi:uncharacterized protein LOC143292807 [Babylonia areolata]|uniref:uncharacterized protein LOC143292807 n=1 Tax=Babylonia areolata TaxID=304850 RepID=UPI003FD10BE3
MADQEAQRREARRQKILRNSENRMNRLLGKPAVSEEAPVGASLRDVPDPNPVPESRNVLAGDTTATDIQTCSADEQTASTSAGEVNPTVSEEPQIVSDTVRHRPHRTLPTEDKKTDRNESVSVLSTKHDAKLSVRTTKNGITDMSELKVETESQLSSGQTDPLRLLDLIRCGGCLLVAFLTRWALRFGLGLLFFEWVMIPFIVLEGSLLYFQTTYMKDLQLPHKSSMMMYALVFSGVKQELIVKFNTIMGYISAATEDFALFMFSFLVCNAVMT